MKLLVLVVLFFLTACSKSESPNAGSSQGKNGLDAKYLEGRSIVGGCAQINRDGTYTFCINHLNRDDGSITENTVEGECSRYEELTGTPYKFVSSCSESNMATACSLEESNGVLKLIEITYSDASSEAIQKTKQNCSGKDGKVIF